MKIGIAGFGFVGKAHYDLLKLDDHEIVISDPAYPEYSGRLPRDVDCIIVCVATPQRPDGSCEMKHVYEVLEDAPDVPVLIKSTISVEGWDFLKETFPHAMLNFSPEFLRAATAVEDLRNMNKLLIGGNSCNFWIKLFGIDAEIADPKELILAKYARNSFLALKVSFFNQMYDLCKQLGIEYNAVAHYTAMDERIGYSHTMVTDERGFGGHCFPKDTLALIKTGQRNNVDLSILREAIEYNNTIRKD